MLNHNVRILRNSMISGFRCLIKKLLLRKISPNAKQSTDQKPTFSSEIPPQAKINVLSTAVFIAARITELLASSCKQMQDPEVMM